MSKKDITYLQFKSTADSLALTNNEVSLGAIQNLLGDFSTDGQIEDYYDRWVKENALKDSKSIAASAEEKAAALEKSLSVSRATLESTADAILIIDNQGKIVDFNQKFLEITEIPKEIIEEGEEGAGLGYLLGLLKNPEELVGQMQYLMAHPDEIGDMGDVHFKNGKVVERYSQPHRIGKEIVGRVWSFRDVTDKRKQEETLRLRNRAITASTHGVVIVANNKNLSITYLNPASIRLINLNEDKVQGKNFLTCFDTLPENLDVMRTIFDKKTKGSVTIEMPINKKIRWLEINIDPVKNKETREVEHFVAIINDITKSKELEKILKYKAVHDALTGLPNKVYIEDAIGYRINSAKIATEKFGVMFIDIDRFKNVNDTLGHRVGDKLLKLFAKRMRNYLQNDDVIARIGGDEFIILLKHIDGIHSLSNIAERLLEACRKRFSYQDHEFNITASIGIAHYPECGKDPETLIRHADIAMYDAKNAGRNTFRSFTNSLNSTISRRIQIENELHSAIEKNEFKLLYQPIYNINHDEFNKAEALIRWNSEKLGFVSPVEFISVAEDVGMMTALGRWIIETTCKQISEWNKNGLNKITVNINVSAKQLLDERFVHHITNTLAKYQLSHDAIVLEMTESFFLLEEKVFATMSELEKVGIRIAIDDFGTGYSNLSYLHKFHVSFLKIDKAFIDEIEHVDFNESVIQAIIAIAKSMNFTIVAEGVESKSQLDYLKENGCDEIQGYYFSKPLEAESFSKFIFDTKK